MPYSPSPDALRHSPESVTWAREKDGRTQRNLAQAVGVSEALMSLIESGDRNASPELIQRMARVLNCPMSVLERKRYTKEEGSAA